MSTKFVLHYDLNANAYGKQRYGGASSCFSRMILVSHKKMRLRLNNFYHNGTIFIFFVGVLYTISVGNFGSLGIAKVVFFMILNQSVSRSIGQKWSK